MLTQLGFEGEDAVVATVKDVVFDAQTFTGHKSAAAKVIPLALHLKSGTQATLSEPKVLKTC